MVSTAVTNRMGPNNADKGISIIISIFLVGWVSPGEQFVCEIHPTGARHRLDVCGVYTLHSPLSTNKIDPNWF